MNKKIHDVQVIQTDSEALYLQVDGAYLQIKWKDCSQQLSQASAVEREIIEVAPSGYGLHWPLLDEDLAIDPLLSRAHKATLPLSEPAIR